MSFAIIVLIVLLLVAFLLLRLVRTQRTPLTNFDDLTGHTLAVDLDALQNLVDPAETQFLRQKLSPAQFRIVQRERILATAEYVRRISHNAGLLIQLGQLTLAGPDPQLVESARVMVERAGHVRIMATMVLMKLYVRSVVPALPLSTDDIFRDYRNLTESAILFTRLQRPAFAGRMGAML